MLFDFTAIHIGVVLLAIIAPLVLGFFWYGPFFGKVWMRDNHLNAKTISKAPITSIFLVSFSGLFLSALFIGLVLQGMSINYTKVEAVTTSTLLGIGFAATSLAINYPYARKSWRLLFIDAGYIVACYALIGLVFGWLA